jgi:5-methylcytosine-specific restriction enzyme A
MADWPYNTTQWRKLRLLKLAHDPLCQACEDMGELTPANTVDHVVAISSGGAPFPMLSDLNSLCHSCHSAKTARGSEAGAIHTRKPRKGCNADGSPLDRRHPWHEKPARNLRLAQDGLHPTHKKSLRADKGRPAARITFELVGFGVAENCHFSDVTSEAEIFPVLHPTQDLCAPDVSLDDDLSDLWG